MKKKITIISVVLFLLMLVGGCSFAASDLVKNKDLNYAHIKETLYNPNVYIAFTQGPGYDLDKLDEDEKNEVDLEGEFRKKDALTKYPIVDPYDGIVPYLYQLTLRLYEILEILASEEYTNGVQEYDEEFKAFIVQATTFEGVDANLEAFYNKRMKNTGDYNEEAFYVPRSYKHTSLLYDLASFECGDGRTNSILGYKVDEDMLINAQIYFVLKAHFGSEFTGFDKLSSLQYKYKFGTTGGAILAPLIQIIDNLKEVNNEAGSVHQEIKGELFEANKQLVDNGKFTNEIANDGLLDEEEISHAVEDTKSPYGRSEWWKAGVEFFKAARNGESTDTKMDFVNDIADMIFDIGNMIIIAVTSILGLRYIFGAAESKARVKDSLLTIVVAALFFYGWGAISDLLSVESIFEKSSYESAATYVYNMVLFFVDIFAVIGFIWLGVKYMLSSAEGKADIKTNWGTLIIGIVLVYATIKFLTSVVSFL